MSGSPSLSRRRRALYLFFAALLAAAGASGFSKGLLGELLGVGQTVRVIAWLVSFFILLGIELRARAPR